MELATWMQFVAQVGAPVDLGFRDGIGRRLVPILGGEVSGAHRGSILGGGADWQTVNPNGVLDIAARYVLSLEEGMVEVESLGVRTAPADVMERLAKGEPVPPSAYYFRTAMRFRTAAPALSYLNGVIGVSAGERSKDAVRLDVRRLT